MDRVSIEELIKEFIKKNENTIKKNLNKEIFIKTLNDDTQLFRESSRIIEGLQDNQIYMVFKPYKLDTNGGAVITNRGVYYRHDSKVVFKTNYRSIKNIEYGEFNRISIETTGHKKINIKINNDHNLGQSLVVFINEIIKLCNNGYLDDEIDFFNQKIEDVDNKIAYEKEKDKSDAKELILPTLFATILFWYINWNILSIFCCISFISSLILYFINRE